MVQSDGSGNYMPTLQATYGEDAGEGLYVDAVTPWTRRACHSTALGNYEHVVSDRYVRMGDGGEDRC